MKLIPCADHRKSIQLSSVSKLMETGCADELEAKVEIKIKQLFYTR